MKTVYVSPFGKKDAAGTKKAPLDTLGAALAAARAKKADKIVLLSGTYEVNETVVLCKEDTGLTIEGEGGVVLSGGVKITPDKITPVRSRNAKKRLPDPEKVLQIDLSGLGLRGTRFGTALGEPRFYVGDRYYENARYPNNERLPGRYGSYLFSERLVVDKEKRETTLYPDSPEAREHLAKMAPEAFEDMFLYGHLWMQWSDTTLKGLSYDPEAGALLAGGKDGYEKAGDTKGKHRRVFLSNVLEELDVPGEYFFDKKKEVLYYIPFEGEDADPVVSVFPGAALSVNGAENVTVRGIRFLHFRTTPVVITDSKNILLTGCEISHTTEAAVKIDHSAGCVVDSCDIRDLASGAVYAVHCGSRPELIFSECAVVNCVISDYNRIERCYRPAVGLTDVCGFDIRGNTIMNGPHNALLFTQINDIMIEDNIFRNLCADTDDVGAIYWGRDPSVLGMTIRGNYFADIGNTEADYNVDAIYVDDWSVCPEIYDNIFYNAGQLTHENMSNLTNPNAIDLNCAQFLNAHNNIFINTYEDQKPVNLYQTHLAARWILYAHDVYEMSDVPGSRSWHTRLENVGYFSEKWQEHYRQTVWAKMYDVVNPEIYDLISEYRRKTAPDGDKEGYKHAAAELGWMVLDYIWDHKTEEGKPYAKTIRDYVIEAYPDQKDHMGDDPLNIQTSLGSKIYWKAIKYELCFRSMNIFRNNVTVGICRDYIDENEKFKGLTMCGFTENYNPMTDKLPDGKSMFVDFGKDFSLTREGLRAVNAVLPEFHNIRLRAGAKR